MPEETTAVGTPLPDMTLPLVAGGELRFADLAGKRVLIFMWGSW